MSIEILYSSLLDYTLCVTVVRLSRLQAVCGLCTHLLNGIVSVFQNSQTWSVIIFLSPYLTGPYEHHFSENAVQSRMQLSPELDPLTNRSIKASEFMTVRPSLFDYPSSEPSPKKKLYLPCYIPLSSSME